MVYADRLLPHSLEAEEAVLGAVLIEPDIIGTLQDSLTPSDFYREANGLVWKAMVATWADGLLPDQVTTASRLAQNGDLEAIGGMSRLSHLVSITPTSVYANHYASVVRECSIKRQIIASLSRSIQESYNSQPSLETIDQSIYALLELRSRQPDETPTVESLGDGVSIAWRWAGLLVHVGQMRREPRALWAELTIQVYWKGASVLEHGPVFYDLMSTQQRRLLADYLRSRWSIDWSRYLEQVSQVAIQEFRKGEPVMNISELSLTEQSPWVLKPLIMEGNPTILFGPGGTGKSLIALAAMLSLEANTEIIPDMVPEGLHRGLYLDWEFGVEPHIQRLSMLCAAHGLERGAYNINYQRCYATLMEMVPQLKQRIQELDVDYVVVDSVAPAVGGDVSKPEVAIAFFRALAELRVGALCIGHVVKGTDTGGKPFGSIFWHNLARSTIEVKAQQDEGTPELHLGLFHRKSNSSQLLPAQGYTIHFAEQLNMIYVDPLDVQANEELSRNTSPRFQIIGLLKHSPGLTYNEIAEQLDIPEATIRKVFSRDKSRTFVEVPGPGRVRRWGLSEGV